MTHPDTDRILERLRAGALEALIDLALDDLLDRPLGELLPPRALAHRVAEVLRALASSEGLEPWLRDQLALLRARTVDPDRPGGRAFPPGETLRQHLPPELTDPIEELLAEPWLPDRALVLRLLDHEAMHSLIQEVLHAALTRFSQKMRSLKPDTSRLRSGLGRHVPTPLSRLKDIGSGVVSAVGSEIESQLDQRVGEFVSHAISAVLGHIASLLTDHARAETMGDWRVYGLRVVLDTELEAFAAEARKLDPDRAVAATARAVRALAARPTLEDELCSLLEAAMEPWTAHSLAHHLAPLGIDDSWRRVARQTLVEQLSPLLDSDAFRAWLSSLLGAEGPT